MATDLTGPQQLADMQKAISDMSQTYQQSFDTQMQMSQLSTMWQTMIDAAKDKPQV